MTYLEKLDAWYQKQRALGNVLDLKFFPGDVIDPEVTAKAVYEILTGVRESIPLDISNL